MEKVTGIGGIFFKASDSKTLGAWYRDHLGIPVEVGARPDDQPAALAHLKTHAREEQAVPGFHATAEVADSDLWEPRRTG